MEILLVLQTLGVVTLAFAARRAALSPIRIKAQRHIVRSRARY